MRGGDGFGRRATLVESVWVLSLSFNAGAKQDVRSRLVSCLSCTRGMEVEGLDNACIGVS